MTGLSVAIVVLLLLLSVSGFSQARRSVKPNHAVQPKLAAGGFTVIYPREIINTKAFRLVRVVHPAF